MRLKRRTCKECKKTKVQKKWDLVNVCHNCYIKTRIIKLNYTCVHCNSKKTYGNWYLGPTCSNCYRKKHYHKFKEKHQERLRKNSKSIKSRFQRGKIAAHYKGVSWKLNLTEYKNLIDKNCYYCQYTTQQQTGTNLDRRNNQKGYTKNNVVPCCKYCNWLKNSILTVKETKLLIEKLKKIRRKTGSPW